ncbi:protein kinase, putative [Trypanosoma cruzi]|uniref:mitogen-activated protein kinase kinase n=4 Tax=Trypanosoma cruzi TaxID=5693 RepID=V5B9R6_TRYCR|nr:protein kinase, putative [Trypanosoma cruzi]ESS62772.1 protein kinase [Trypanosoma cruzi Dm28c]PBJ68579.1 protein kinase [Trypanosoma cruzi cruzi]KAF8287204.1 putative mitogen-activated protein kinase kinase 4 [Trypanosoma cruzi]PBJ76308.1 protein kinase [Trypanosoma cruzi cruzi]
MPPKRPVLENLRIDPPEKTVSITDTLTLVVKGDGGLEMRVKESFMASGPAFPAQAAKQKDDKNDVSMEKIRFEDLRTCQELGKGSQGRVRLARHLPTGKRYAVKYIRLEEDTDGMRQALESELRQVKALMHKNLVTSHEAFFRDGRVYIVLEYMDAGSIADVLRRHPNNFNEVMLAYVARELLQGLEHLHASKVIHRDIKPVNALANSKGEVKIADFGVAKRFSGGDVETLSAQGSLIYMSPERIQGQPYSFNSDIWSVGLTIAECALGAYPFASMKHSLYDLMQAIATRTARVDWTADGREHSSELIDFVDQCLRPVSSRPTATELLHHPFIQKAANVDPAEAGRWFVTQS